MAKRKIKTEEVVETTEKETPKKTPKKPTKKKVKYTGTGITSCGIDFKNEDIKEVDTKTFEYLLKTFPNSFTEA